VLAAFFSSGLEATAPLLAPREKWGTPVSNPCLALLPGAPVWLITLGGEFDHCNPLPEISILKHLPENQVGIGSARGRARMGRSVL
jgi:hypothetical protein